MELRAGGTLGRYELLVRIGRGGMASVWVARERTTRSERLVAVKAMLPELAQKPDFRSMFLDEGQIVRSIDHPNVVQIYEVSEDRGVLYMAMEWVEGDSLRVVIQEAKKRRAVPPEIAVRIIADTAAGLHAAHELRGWDGELRGIVHCDVSPHNILVGVNGQSKLVDFGVASAVEQLRAEDEQDRVAGKFAYMSPEQASARPVDRRSDVFSLGVVLYELTTGERLFKADDPAQTLDLVRHAEIPRPASLDAGYPERLEAIVLRALARDPSQRYQTADELKQALERYLVQERILVSRASVAQLLRRVVGARIDKRRQLIKAVLQSLDGELKAGLVPTASAAADFNEHSLNTSVSTVMTGVSSLATVSNGKSRWSRSHSGSSVAQILETRSASRSPMTWLLALGGLVAAGAAGYVLHTRAAVDTARVTAAPAAVAAKTATAASGTPSASEGVTSNAISVDSLPVAGSAVPGAARAGAPRPGRAAAPSQALAPATPATPEPPPPEDVPAPAAEESSPAEPEQPPAPEAPPEPERPPPPAAAATGPLNAGAAMAALGSAASSLSRCRSDDGPSGSGQATITFQPNGTVSAVSVSSPFKGTPVGACIAATFKRVRLQPFTGSSVTLSRSFSIRD